MKVLVDTSVIVDIDRGKQEVIEVCRKLTSDREAYVSAVTVSEILTGSYLREDYRKSVAKAKRVLGQFSWVSLDGQVAEKIAQLSSYLISRGQPVEYQDQAIAASCLVIECDFLLTNNKEHFKRIPALKNKVLTPLELRNNV